MSARSSIEQVAGGARANVLSVSFTGVELGRDLDSLLAKETRGFALHRIDPLGDLTAASGYVSLPAMARGYAEQAAGLAPIAVIGYCTAATLALALAEELAAAGDRAPLVVLLDPLRPTPASVARSFEDRRRAFGRTEPPVADVDCQGDPGTALSAMASQLALDATAFAADNEMDAEDADAITTELVARYRAWLGFLLATAHHAPAGDALAVRCLMSRDREIPAALVDPSSVRRLALSAEELPGADAVRELVFEMIEAGASHV
ncbi:hypothetical protein [Amycolatopsis thailandensis]|uniref:hypothetical protein n=1 Tax=Amycolatopsis thailandensis TaxID=589330 RepID=UPI00362F1B04